MTIKNSFGAAATGAAGGGLTCGGLLGASVALMDPAMPQAMVLVGTAIYGGAVCGAILGAIVAIVRSEQGPGSTAVDAPVIAMERAA